MMRGRSKVVPDYCVGLALSGGAARCIAQIGVLEVLEREGIRVTAISGTSGGSLVGAMYASGEVDVHEMQKMARAIKWRKVLKPTLIAIFAGVVATGIMLVGFVFNAVL